MSLIMRDTLWYATASRHTHRAMCDPLACADRPQRDKSMQISRCKRGAYE